MAFIEQVDAELSASVNKHWREVAEYERYVKPLLVRLQAVEWPTVLTLHSARWQREAAEAIRARRPCYHYCSLALSHQELIKESQKHKPSEYGWLGSYYNPHTGKYRRIQRYPLVYIHDTGTYPVRFCPPGGQPVSWGFWFRTSDLKSRDWTLGASAWRSYRDRKEVVGQWLANREAAQRNGPNRRQYLADRLRSVSQQLGRYERKNYLNASGAFYEDLYKLDYNLCSALAINEKNETNSSIYPSELGEIEAKLEHFRGCLAEFHEAETTASPLLSTLPPATNVPAATRYFPDLVAYLAAAPVGYLHEMLDEALAEYKAGKTDLTQGDKFAAQLAHYTKISSLSAPHRQRIEGWAFWTRERECRLLDELTAPETKEAVSEADRRALESRLAFFLKRGDAETRPEIKDNIALLRKRLAELGPPAAQPEAAAPGPSLPTLSPAERILAPDFTLDEADRLARVVGLIDEAGGYCLGPRKLGAVVGFALALQQAGKLTGAIPALTAVLAPRWGINVATRKTGTKVADKYFKLTNKALPRPRKTD